MKINLKGWNKTDTDKTHTTFKNKDGHEFRVAHAALTKENRKEIDGMPMVPKKMADGGNVDGTPVQKQREETGRIKQSIDDGNTAHQVAPMTQDEARARFNTTARNLNQGGTVQPKFANAQEQQNAEDMSRGASKGESISDMASAAKDAWGQLTNSQPKYRGGNVQHLAEGGDVQATPDTQAAPEPAAQPAQGDPDPIQAKQQLYNQIITGSTDPATLVNMRGAVFGPDGSQPTNINAQVASQADQMYQNQLKQKNAETMQNVAHVNEDNAARQALGVKPIPVPSSLTTPQLNTPPPADVVNKNNQTQPGAMNETPSDPFGQNAVLQSYDAGVQEQKSGIMGEANALGALGTKEASIQGDQAQKQQAQIDSYNQHYQQLDQERQHFQSDIENQHIDPNKYMGDLGTGGRIATGIGLILGGLGSGITGGENPALKILNMNIDRDIAAQKANLGKSENLLSANLHQFGNLRDATSMTQVMMNDVASSKLKQAAAAAQDPLAKNRALQAAGQLDQASAQQHGQMAMRRMQLGMMQSTRDPAVAAQHASTLIALGYGEQGKDLQSKVVPGVGVADTPVPEGARQTLIASKNVNDLFNRSLEFSAQHAGSMDPRVTAQAAVIQNQLIGVIKQAQHDGVYKPSEATFLMSQIGGSPSSFMAKVSSVPKIQEMQRIKQQEYQENLRAYGIQGPNTQLPGAQPQQEAPQYKTDANGVKWQRGPNGKAIRVK